MILAVGAADSTAEPAAVAWLDILAGVGIPTLLITAAAVGLTTDNDPTNRGGTAGR